MISPKSHQPSRSDNAADYDRLFISRVHELLQRGYDRLTPRQYATAEETAITGDLVESIKYLLDYPTEDWMRFYSVYDDPPVNEPRSRNKKRRKGRGRRRVDIRFDSSENSPRTRLRYECKRLGKGHAAGQYVGPTGLGCFLKGEYAARDVRAGMLGYVQSHDEATWASRIEIALAKSAEDFAVRVAWQHSPVSTMLKHAYCSAHGRGRGRKPIVIYHTLLRFH